MKRKGICLFIILLGLFVLPNDVAAEEATSEITGCSAVQITGMQHLNSNNELGRQWNIYVGSQRVFCMDAGKKARTNETCTYLRPATSEETKQLTNVQENKQIAQSLDAKTYTDILTSAGQGTLGDGVGIQMNMLTNGYDKYSINRTVEAYTTTVASSSKNYVVYACNGDPEGNTWQRMLVPTDVITCGVKEEKKSCPKGQMVKEDLNLSCDRSCTNKDSDKSKCNPKAEVSKTSNGTGDGVGVTTHVTYSASSGDKSYIHADHGYDLGAGVGKFCRVYCTEEGWATMPGGIDEPLSLGSYIVWPTSQSNFTSDKYRTYYYPLRFKGQLNCELDVMSDLEPDHANMPVGCHDAVENTYSKNYTYVVENWSQKDYNKDTYEFVRYNYIRRTKNPSGLCRANYDVGGQSCSKTTQFAMGSDGAKYTYCYSKILTRLGVEEKILSKLQQELAAINPTSCPEPEYCWDVDEKGNKRSVTCGEKDPCKDQYDAKKREVDHQQSIVNGFNTAKSTIEGAMGACTSYTDAYEVCAGIQHEMHICGKWQISDDDYNFSSNAKLSYSDNINKDKELISYTLNEDLELVKQDGPNVTNPGITDITDFPDTENKPWTDLLPSGTLIGKIQQLVNKKFSVDQTDYYGLKTSYQFQDKNKLQYKTDKPKDIDKNGVDRANFITITTNKVNGGAIVDNDESGIIPTSYDNKAGQQYTLKIYDIFFGQAQFGLKDDSDNGSEYACKVTFIDNDDKCVCPEGKKNAGKSLDCTGLKCASAISKYCDDETYVEDAKCKRYCESDMSISISACLNQGKSYDECAELCDIHCSNSAEVDDPDMDANLIACVSPLFATGISIKDAIAWCEPQVCRIGGKRIIYRTIRLENPFPSYDADSSTGQTGLKAACENGGTYSTECLAVDEGIFNNTVKGRYPGTNWNDEQTVYEKIRYNRNTAGTSVYDIAPLYTFILNSSTIDAIRNYNDKIEAGYNDFSLRCRSKDRTTACVSDFVHDRSLSGLVGGVCATSTSVDDFYTCVYKHSES